MAITKSLVLAFFSLAIVLAAGLVRIGIVPGESFDFGKAEPVVKKALENAASDALPKSP